MVFNFFLTIDGPKLEINTVPGKDPKAKKTIINSVFDVLTAYPRALPMNGAVQGVATTTVNAPLRKLPKNPE